MTTIGNARSALRRSLVAGAVTLAVLASVGLAPSGASAQVSAEQAGMQIAEAYDVEVLKVAEGEIDGAAVWLVTVMNAKGDYNEAFQVNVLAVDRQSGKLVPSFRHRASGYVLPPGGRNDRTGVRPEAVRSGAWR